MLILLPVFFHQSSNKQRLESNLCFFLSDADFFKTVTSYNNLLPVTAALPITRLCIYPVQFYRLPYRPNRSRKFSMQISVTDGIVNGALGTIKGIINGQKPYGLPQFIAIKFDNTRVGANAKKTQEGLILLEPHSSQKIRRGTKSHIRHQYPLKVAFASTVHKVQGATMEGIVVNMAKVNRPGQAYVALSRCTSLHGLSIVDYTDQHIFADPKVTPALQNMSTIPDYLLQPIATIKANSDHFHLVAVHLNVQSLLKNYNNLKLQKDIISADLILLTETWLPQQTSPSAFPLEGKYIFSADFNTNSVISNAYSLTNHWFPLSPCTGYRALHYPRSAPKGGGISIYHKDFLNITPVLNLEDSFLNHIVAVESTEQSSLICVVYRYILTIIQLCLRF